MIASDICPICGKDTVIKEVTEIIKGGGNTATVSVEAEVCCHCGERLYLPETIRKFEQIKYQLEHQETEKFKVIGKSFLVV